LQFIGARFPEANRASTFAKLELGDGDNELTFCRALPLEVANRALRTA
jgi:hypothetical protein